MAAKTRVQVNFAIHRQMELHFGERSCEASHKWLNENFGTSHVANLTQQQAERALGRLRTMPVKVRDKIWDMISPSLKADTRAVQIPPLVPEERMDSARESLIVGSSPGIFTGPDNQAGKPCPMDIPDPDREKRGSSSQYRRKTGIPVAQSNTVPL